MAARFEIERDEQGAFRFLFRTADGQLLATGQTCSTKSDCKYGIEALMKNAPVAEIVDHTR
ncbi:YegP family protein [Nocardia takedensis]|uniref:YegP family protein n=1 Tax=Nocardia takedensis TaxID=259390 RepID=UPI0002D71C8C|nr:DUF1508 domain-containing protein [Nocardia takedensis]